MMTAHTEIRSGDSRRKDPFLAAFDAAVLLAATQGAASRINVIVNYSTRNKKRTDMFGFNADRMRSVHASWKEQVPF